MRSTALALTLSLAACAGGGGDVDAASGGVEVVAAVQTAMTWALTTILAETGDDGSETTVSALTADVRCPDGGLVTVDIDTLSKEPLTLQYQYTFSNCRGIAVGEETWDFSGTSRQLAIGDVTVDGYAEFVGDITFTGPVSGTTCQFEQVVDRRSCPDAVASVFYACNHLAPDDLWKPATCLTD